MKSYNHSLARVLMLKALSLDYYHQRKSNCFNFIRLLAATLVIFSHSFNLTHGNSNPIVDSLVIFPGGAHPGVVAFFILSGYLITESFIKHDNLFFFLKCRILRIFPGLIVAVFFSVFIIGILNTTLPIITYLKTRAIYGYIFRHAILLIGNWYLPGVFKDNYLPLVNACLWTLPYEFICYLLVATLGIWGVFKKKYLKILYLLAIAAMLFTFGPQTSIIKVFFMSFFLGSAFYFLRKYIMLNIWVFILLLAVGWIFRNTSLYYSVWRLITFAYPIFLVGYCLPTSGRFVTKYGDFSYGLYIFTFPVQQTIINFFQGIQGWHVFFTAYPIGFLLAIISWFWIEKPALSFKDTNILEHMRSMLSGKPTAVME